MPFVPDDKWQATLAKIDLLEKEVAELKKRLARYDNAHTPSSLSLSNVHLGKVGSNKKSGRKQGHKGVGRTTPDITHKHRRIKLKVCSHCGRKVRCKSKRKRTVTDIKPGTTVNTEYEIERGFCGNCKKLVEPVLADALPNSRFGLKLALYIAFLSVLGVTTSKIAAILLHDYNLKLSKATICNTMQKLADFLGEDYEKLRQQLLKEKELFGDETGWPINGKKGWLWTFIGKTVALLTVEMSRGQKVVEKNLGAKYDGILHSDFWSAYNIVECKKQKCLAHLKRELRFLKRTCRNKELKTYCTKLLVLLTYSVKKNRHTTRFKQFCETRLHAIIDKKYKNEDCNRLNKRLRRHVNEIFTFIDSGVETTNNKAERSLRPNVIKRKNTYGSKSLQGAQAHAVLASFHQTSQLQDKNFENFIGELVENQLNQRTEN
jgi:hypothetical protein